ncbi:MAG: histidine phosphatase family protein [Eubacterium sp.]|nr:histidine phosphatase family protein [Eubacterium sp.]
MMYLIRHGQTVKNKENVLQGRSNSPLNEVGRQQAEAAGEMLKAAGISFDKVYTSPLIRAVQTAEIIAGDVPLTVDDRLIEMDYGPYEGMELKNPAPEVLEFFRDFAHNPAPEGMEQLPDIVARLGAFLEEIREEAARKNLLLSTHAIAMKGALEYLTPDSNGRYWSKYVGNCEIYTAEVGADGNWSVPVSLQNIE